MKTVELVCTEGNASLQFQPKQARAMILTGRRKRPDLIHWCLMRVDAAGEMLVAVQGISRGRYADAVVTATELHRGLTDIGDLTTAASIARACSANGVTLTADSAPCPPLTLS